MNTNFHAIGLIRLGIKPESAAPEADAATTRPSKLKEIFSKLRRLIEQYFLDVY